MSFFNRHYKLFSLLLIYLLGLISYFNSFRGEFVFDDVNTIIRQENLRNLDDIAKIWQISHSRFIPYLSYALNYHFNDLDPPGYHAVNFIIHILNAFLVYFLVLKAGKSLRQSFGQAKILAVLTAVIFAIHPIETQAVTYISQRFTLLAAFFYLTTLILYLRRTFISYLLSLLTLILAMLSKENSYTLPLAILVTDLFFSGGIEVKNRFFRILPYFLISAAVFSFIYLPGYADPISRISSMNMLDNIKITRTEYLLTQINVVRTYLRLLIFPVNQTIDYDYPISRNFWEPQVFYSLGIIIFVIIIAVKQLKKRPLFAFGMAIFFITLVIESSIFPIKDVIFEHRLYLPSVGFILAASTLMMRIKNQYHFYGIAILLLITLSYMTFKRNYIWLSEYNLWTDAVLKSPKKARVHYNLGVASYGINKYEEAKKELQTTIELDPFYSDVYSNLGTIYIGEKKFDQALFIYQKGLEKNYYDTKVRAGLAAYYSQTGEYDHAADQYLTILKYDPNNAFALNDLGMVYFNQNKKEEVISALEQAISLNPNYETAVQNLANTYFHFGEYTQAKGYYLRLLGINPNNAQAIYSLRELDKK